MRRTEERMAAMRGLWWTDRYRTAEGYALQHNGGRVRFRVVQVADMAAAGSLDVTPHGLLFGRVPFTEEGIVPFDAEHNDAGDPVLEDLADGLRRLWRGAGPEELREKHKGEGK